LGGTGVRLKRPSTGLQEPGNDLSAPAVASTTGPTEDSIRTGPQRHSRQIVCSLSRQAVSLMTPVSASTSTSVRRRSATSSRRLGFQSCNGPRRPRLEAPNVPTGTRNDASRTQFDFRQSRQITFNHFVGWPTSRPSRPSGRLDASFRSAAGSRPLAASPRIDLTASRALARDMAEHEPSGMRRFSPACRYWARKNFPPPAVTRTPRPVCSSSKTRTSFFPIPPCLR
jgi:hypothetical protein